MLIQTKPLLLLAATVFADQTANGAMLPFLAQARTAAGADPSLTTGAMTVVSQATMVGAALLAARAVQGRGHARVLSLALGLVVVRGILAAFATSRWLVIPVQVLEGLAMGLGGVAIPALVAEIMDGTGHASAGLGGVMTACGAGATVSPMLAGPVAQDLGLAASFVALAAVAASGSVMWMIGCRLLGMHGSARQADRAAAEPV